MPGVESGEAVGARATKTALYGYRAKPIYEAVKRVFDVVVASVALILLSPAFAVIAVMIRAEDGGSVFYKQERICRNGKSFRIYKFRSMRPDADRLEEILTPEQLKEYKQYYWLADDPRLTRVGRRIRKTSLDELPQLLNILKGEISVVGPRPVQEEELAQYGEYRSLLTKVRPGLTGYWQAYARCNVSYVDFRRQDMDLYYVTNRSLLLDVKILLRTVCAVLRRDGAF